MSATIKSAAVIIVALLLGELHVPAFQESSGKFIIGVLRRDGIVTPFAMFDGKRWRTRWPMDIRNQDLPISLDDVPENWWGIEPAPRKMTIWRDAQPAGTINLTGITLSRLMCEPRITLKSDYKPAAPAPPRFEAPYPKDGIVVAGGDVRLERIEAVERGAADWKRALTVIADEFNRQETNAARQFTDWSHPVKERDRKVVPITIEALYRSPSEEPEWPAYFVEAVRQYPPGRNDRDGCGLATFASGWVFLGPKDEARIRLAAKVTYCDRKGVGYMLPFGFIRADGNVYWIYQYSGFEQEWYEVAEPTRRGVNNHVVYAAGGC
jgi:hypothetical protein